MIYTHTLSLTHLGLIQTMTYFPILMPHIKISISALRLDRNLGFLRGHQGHWPPDDDDDEEEDDNEVEDNDNYRDDNNDKSISAMVSRGHQTKPTKHNQTKPNPTKPNEAKPNQTKPSQPNQKAKQRKKAEQSTIKRIKPEY